MSQKADEVLRMCRLVRTRGKRTREGARSGVGRLERMKRGNGTKDRDDRSSGVEILIRGFRKNQPN
jgi:hypothetical protein